MLINGLFTLQTVSCLPCFNSLCWTSALCLQVHYNRPVCNMCRHPVIQLQGERGTGKKPEPAASINIWGKDLFFSVLHSSLCKDHQPQQLCIDRFRIIRERCRCNCVPRASSFQLLWQCGSRWENNVAKYRSEFSTHCWAKKEQTQLLCLCNPVKVYVWLNHQAFLVETTQHRLIYIPSCPFLIQSVWC